MRIMTIRKLTTLIYILAVAIGAAAQGVSRPNGLGLRVSFWNLSEESFSVRVDARNQNVNMNLNGLGVWFFYFSRLHDNWFLQSELGVIGSVAAEEDASAIGTRASGSSIVPILFGLRYDLLPGRTTSMMQPYVAAGAGPHWISDFRSETEIGQAVVESKTLLKYGGYAGAGLQVIAASWLAFNFDLKYHWVDFDRRNPYSGIEFGAGAAVMWGRPRELLQIKQVKLIVQDIYPVYYPFYNAYPLALVTVRNVFGSDIEVNVRSFIEGFSDRPRDSGFIRLKRGETRDIPVMVIFNEAILQSSHRQPAVLDLTLEAKPGSRRIQTVHVQITVHQRQAWNGEVDKLRFYLSADDSEVISQARRMVEAAGADFTDSPAVARAIWDALSARGLVYRRDPAVPYYQDDRVQSAQETLELGSGDCDDLTVLYASLLQSLGIRTAFVDVRDPQKMEAHLYLLFDSGVPSAEGERISSNEKKYILRGDEGDRSTIWLPVETTLLGRPFDDAWINAAQQYQSDAVLRGGLVEGWVKVIDNR